MSDDETANGGSTGPSDEEDMCLFEAFLRPEYVAAILRLKRNEPEETEFRPSGDFNEVASRRLGQILAQNTRLTTLTLWCNFNVTGLCAGIRTSTSIQRFDISGNDLSGVAEMNSLASFLADNPNFESITLFDCDIGPGSLEILMDALSGRRTRTLRVLDLGANVFGDANLDSLVRALMPEKSHELTRLTVRYCGICLQGCASLATLLRGNSSRGLQLLNLEGNAIDDACARVLAESLVDNSRLRDLNLSENRGNITAQGWKAFVGLIYDSKSIECISASNHTLCSLGVLDALDAQRLFDALGDDDANNLHAALRINHNENKIFVAKQKVVWSHAQGRLNVGDSSIVAGAIPQMLSCFSTFSNETDNGFIQWHHPPLCETRIAAMGLSAVFRILQARPDLCHAESKPRRSVRRRRCSGGRDTGVARPRIV